jgi:CRP/FNR family transcriptional regulator, cyclic AMP receptor protein
MTKVAGSRRRCGIRYAPAMPQSLPDAFIQGRRQPARSRPSQTPTRTRRRSVVALSGVPLFSGFSKRHLQRLAAAADDVAFRAGERIVEQGNPGETLFVLLEGEAKVIRDGRARTRLIPGDFFGEISVLDGGPRTASVEADTPVSALRVFRHTLLEMIEAEPRLALRLLEGIARRIREIDRSLTR